MSGSPHAGIVRHHDEPQIDLTHIHEQHDFGWAITQLKAGGLVRRRGWNGKGMWLVLFREWNGAMVKPVAVPPDWNGFLPFIAMYTATKEIVPWLASQTDMLADDWERAE